MRSENAIHCATPPYGAFLIKDRSKDRAKEHQAIFSTIKFIFVMICRKQDGRQSCQSLLMCSAIFFEVRNREKIPAGENSPFRENARPVNSMSEPRFFISITLQETKMIPDKRGKDLFSKIWLRTTKVKNFFNVKVSDVLLS